MNERNLSKNTIDAYTSDLVLFICWLEFVSKTDQSSSLEEDFYEYDLSNSMKKEHSQLIEKYGNLREKLSVVGYVQFLKGCNYFEKGLSKSCSAENENNNSNSYKNTPENIFLEKKLVERDDLQESCNSIGDNKSTDEDCTNKPNKRAILDSTLFRKINSIKQLFLFCKEQIEGCNDVEVDFPKIKLKRSNLKVINDEEVNEILEDLNKSNTKFSIKLHAMLSMLYSTGLRASEIICITLNDLENVINGSEKSFRIIGKGGKERQVFMNRKAIESLKRYLLSNSRKIASYIWPSTNGHITRQTLFLWVKKIGLSPHDLRHKLGSNLVKKGMNLLEVRKVMGHSSVKTTSIYTHASNSSSSIKKHHPMYNKSKDS
ncbi:tyrosine-type recombinase/integrase [Candidatus Nesciobacter abundans]|nr:tyrosine-type recombinase/integrase [Candidatus Nesciobacter abundans]